jgi:hypothetical protein
MSKRSPRLEAGGFLFVQAVPGASATRAVFNPTGGFATSNVPAVEIYSILDVSTSVQTSYGWQANGPIQRISPDRHHRCDRLSVGVSALFEVT